VFGDDEFLSYIGAVSSNYLRCLSQQ